jgi:membrane protein DedA with SNARE-associated domain
MHLGQRAEVFLQPFHQPDLRDLPDVPCRIWRDDGGISGPLQENETMIHFSPETITQLIAGYGYAAVFLLVAIESMGIPAPGETTLMAASLYAGTTHRLSVAVVIAAAAAGAIVGDNLGFVVGYQGGTRLLRRYGKYVGLHDHRLRLAQHLLDAHGGKVVFFGRFLPVLRVWAAVLAGTHRMPWKRFLALNAAGGIVWASVMGLGAYLLGSSAEHLGAIVGAAVGLVMTCLMIGLVVLMKRNERRWELAADRDLTALQAVAA